MGKEEKIVVDTNVFISAFVWNNKPEQAIAKALDSGTVIISSQQLDEVRRVLRYKRLNISERKQQWCIRFLAMNTIGVEVPGKLTVVDDPDDNIILESAVVAKADVLITGDDDLLRIKNYDGIRIMKPAAFLRYE
ncbi:MAG: putative toxin-antitoxin system toxin component, PIN family [Candidatus Woesearchaeota archaeon]|nr:putative toxin-antitoxin system toxin component, PIN family [Candidatus Woesearchaeota archaeon]